MIKLWRPFRISIRAKILLGFLLVMIVSYSAQVISYITTDTFIKKQTLRNLEDKAVNASVHIENFIHRTEFEQLILAELYLKNTTGDNLQLADYSRLLIRQNPYFSRIAILSSTGKEVFKADKAGTRPPYELSFEIVTDSFTKALNGHTAISKVYFDEEHKLPYVDIYSPVLSQKGEVVSVVKSQLQLVNLWNLIAQVRVGEEGYTYVVDGDGRLIAHRDNQLTLEAPLLLERPIVSKLISGHVPDEKDHVYTNEAGTVSVANGLNIASLDWTVIAEQPVSEAYAQRTILRNLFISTLTGSVLLLVVLAILISSQLTQPISELHRFANSLQLGHLDKEVEIKSGDEIEQLANAFNQMAKNLKRAFSELHDKVIELERNSELLTERDENLNEINTKLAHEKNLVEAERNKMEMVLSGISDAVVAVDLTKKIVIFNPAAERLTGISKQAAIGMPIGDVLTVFEGGYVIKPEVYCPQNTPDYEGILYSKPMVKIQSSKGKSAITSLIAGQIKESSEVNLGAIITLHDITKEQELERMKLDFVSMATHELRTPLTSVQGYISLLNEGETLSKLNDEEKEYLERAATGGVRLAQLIENLLIVSRIENGSMVIHPQPAQLEDLVEGVCRDLQKMAESKGLELICNRPSQPLAQVLADPMRINEVVTNLLSNAITYTQDGKIIVGFSQSDTGVTFSVSDSGPGIPEDAQPHLFTKFFRVQGVLEAGSKGTGLGLYISKNIIDSHHGQIWVESKEGQGSTFFFELPRADSIPTNPGS